MPVLKKMKDCIMNIMDNSNLDLKIGLVIMASGLGKRFGSNKLMEPFNNKPLIRWVLDSTEGLFDKRVVVTRSREVFELCNNLNIKCILHEFPGRNDTVRLGLSEIEKDIDYCFFMQGDQPLISRESIEKLILCASENRGKIVRAGYRDNVGSPMGFPYELFDELLNLPNGKGGNYIAKNNHSCVQVVEVLHEYELWDVDTPSDLQRISIPVTGNIIMPEFEHEYKGRVLRCDKGVILVTDNNAYEMKGYMNMEGLETGDLLTIFCDDIDDGYPQPVNVKEMFFSKHGSLEDINLNILINLNKLGFKPV